MIKVINKPVNITRRKVLNAGIVTALTIPFLAKDHNLPSKDFGKRALSYGIDNTYVKNIQQTLNFNYGYNIVEDGYFGLETKEAVTKFQKLKGITEDGTVNDETKEYLRGKLPIVNEKFTHKRPYVFDNEHNIEFFDGVGQNLYMARQDSSVVNGTRVRYIWETLQKLEYVSEIPKTSRMTYNVELYKAVKKFQADNDLNVDGVVGEKTWSRMNLLNNTNYSLTMDNYIAPTLDNAVYGDSTQRIYAMVEYFEKFENKVPYTWGGMGYQDDLWAGFDCSGLIYQMLASAGVIIQSTNPVLHAQKSFRTSQAIYHDPRLKSVPLKDVQNGDIITFTHRDTRLPEKIAHDGIFFDGYMLECYAKGVKRTRWENKDIHRDGYGLFAMPFVKRAFNV